MWMQPVKQTTECGLGVKLNALWIAEHHALPICIDAEEHAVPAIAAEIRLQLLPWRTHLRLIQIP